MSDFLELLSTYMSFPFVRYALIVGTLISLCSALLGVTLVLKRFSYIGDGLSHVAFGALSVASVVDIGLKQLVRVLEGKTAVAAVASWLSYLLRQTNNMALVLPVTVMCAVLLLRTGQNAKIRGDAVIAMISVGALATGYLLLNVFSASANVSGDVCSTLFGSTSILTLTTWEVWLCVGLSVAVVAVFIIFYNRIFAVTFDESFARAIGARVRFYNSLIAVTVAVIIVLAMNLVGSLLISALVIFPAISAMCVFKSFRQVTVCSVAIAVGGALLGMLIAIFAATPVGSTIVVVDLVIFIVFRIIGSVRK